jgi:protein-tyrosine phosphatase
MGASHGGGHNFLDSDYRVVSRSAKADYQFVCQMGDQVMGAAATGRPPATQRKLPLEMAHNARTLGGYRTRSGRITSDRLIRADCMVPLSAGDRDVLIDRGISAVIDLRSADEIAKIPSAFFGSAKVDYHNIPLLSGAAGDMRFPKDFTMGMMYIGLLEGAANALRDVFRVIAKASGAEGKLMFHCAAGKDRTGVVAALSLDLAGVDDETIVRDYAETGRNLAPVMDLLRENGGVPADMGELTDELLSARAENMETMLRFLNGKWGGARAYLSEIGLSGAETALIYKMMTESEE